MDGSDNIYHAIMSYNQRWLHLLDGIVRYSYSVSSYNLLLNLYLFNKSLCMVNYSRKRGGKSIGTMIDYFVELIVMQMFLFMKDVA